MRSQNLLVLGLLASSFLLSGCGQAPNTATNTTNGSATNANANVNPKLQLLQQMQQAKTLEQDIQGMSEAGNSLDEKTEL